MNRRHLTFSCGGEQLVGTVDDASGHVGLLVITGGNETRAGAFSGQAQMAERIAAHGYPVFRFDRRGVGDSTGENAGFREAKTDISAAIAAFRAECPALTKIAAFGNCDAASALMLGSGKGCDALLLANPWTFDEAGEAPPPEAIRKRYAAKLKNPREWLRLLRGGVSFKKLAGGLARATRPTSQPSSLAHEMHQGIAHFSGPVRYLLAADDRTGQAFMSAWPGRSKSWPESWKICENAGHSFAQPHARQWLEDQLLAALEEQAGQLDVA